MTEIVLGTALCVLVVALTVAALYPIPPNKPYRCPTCGVLSTKHRKRLSLRQRVVYLWKASR